MATAFPVRAQTALRALSRDIPMTFRTLPAKQPPREIQHEHALPGMGLMPRASDENLRECIPDG